jgi:F-box-like
MLPDEVLLAIFDLLVDESLSAGGKEIEAWQSLVHVCRQWRRVVFGSPRRLNLRLVCTSKTSVRNTLDIWPSFPLFIIARDFDTSGVNNIIAGLEHRDHVHRIDLMDVPSSQLNRVSAAMQEPFPELIYLQVISDYGIDSLDGPMPALPDSFLGGSAPRLQELNLKGIPFPGLPKLLLSAAHLDTLYLRDIPHSGYISPGEMAAALSTLTSLRCFGLEFESPRSRPYRESGRPPFLTRSVLPVLTDLSFKGVCEYLDNLVALIDTPQLTKLQIIFFNQAVFDAPQLVQFISRAEALKTLEKARLICTFGAAMVKLSPQASRSTSLCVIILCRNLDRQIWSLGQVFTLCLPHLSALEDCYIYGDRQPELQDKMVDELWLELLYPFTAARNLYITEEFAQRIVPVLQEVVGARTTQVFPALRNIFLEGLQPSGPVQECVGHFAATRQATGHPIAVSRWVRDRTIYYEFDN